MNCLSSYGKYIWERRYTYIKSKRSVDDFEVVPKIYKSNNAYALTTRKSKIYTIGAHSHTRIYHINERVLAVRFFLYRAESENLITFARAYIWVTRYFSFNSLTRLVSITLMSYR